MFKSRAPEEMRGAKGGRDSVVSAEGLQVTVMTSSHRHPPPAPAPNRTQHVVTAPRASAAGSELFEARKEESALPLDLR